MSRYFILEGALRERYEELEKQELEGFKQQRIELGKRGVKSWRRSRHNSIIAVTFEEGKRPEGIPFVRARTYLGKEEVRPHGNAKAAKEWREFLKGIKVTVSASSDIGKELKLPMMVFTRPSVGRGGGMVMTSSRIAHVGPEVVAQTPVPDGMEPKDDKFVAKEGMREIKTWEFEKLKEETSDYKHEKPCFTMA